MDMSNNLLQQLCAWPLKFGMLPKFNEFAHIWWKVVIQHVPLGNWYIRFKILFQQNHHVTNITKY
jgi:hypothetical protein